MKHTDKSARASSLIENKLLLLLYNFSNHFARTTHNTHTAANDKYNHELNRYMCIKNKTRVR